MSGKRGGGRADGRRRATPSRRGGSGEVAPKQRTAASKGTVREPPWVPSRPGAGRSRGTGPPRPAAGRSPLSRPATASRGRAASPAEEHRSAVWVRGTILLSILVVLAVTLAPTARSLLRQRGEIAALQDKVVQQQQSVADLQREQARWTDPAYVEQQARERLKFVKVGDRSYSVIDPATEAPKPPDSAVVAAPQADANAPWYGQVWQSVRLADQPSAGMAPVPDK